MMRGLLILSGFWFAHAEVDPRVCALNAGRAVDEMLDSVIYIWASVERCGTNTTGHHVKCMMDLSQAAESVTAVANVLVHAMHDCGAIKGDACGMQAGKLVQSAAGLTAAAGGIYEKCATMDTPAPGHLVPQPVGKWAMCLVDIKDSLRSLLKATQRIMHAENKCESHEDCAQTATSIIAAFAAIGQYASSAVGHCSPADPQTGAMTGKAHPFMSASTARNVKCGSHIAQATRHAAALSSTAITMARTCAASHSRLYELDKKAAKDAQQAASSTPFLFLLPFVAVVSFVGGSRFARAKAVRCQDEETAPLHFVDVEATD